VEAGAPASNENGTRTASTGGFDAEERILKMFDRGQYIKTQGNSNQRVVGLERDPYPSSLSRLDHAAHRHLKSHHTYFSRAEAISSGCFPTRETTIPSTLPSSFCPASAAQASIPSLTWASMIVFGQRVLGLGASGKFSDVPVCGGENAEAGRRGRLFGSLRRKPTPGEGGIGGSELMV
jgi:hypothetical protein